VTFAPPVARNFSLGLRAHSSGLIVSMMVFAGRYALQREAYKTAGRTRQMEWISKAGMRREPCKAGTARQAMQGEHCKASNLNKPNNSDKSDSSRYVSCDFRNFAARVSGNH
jgi:hypothetical protein